MKDKGDVQAVAAIILVTILVLGSLTLAYLTRPGSEPLQGVPPERFEKIEKRIEKIEESLQKGRYRMDELNGDCRENFHLFRKLEERLEKMEKRQEKSHD